MRRFNTKINPTRQHKQIKKNINQTRHILKKGQFGLRSLEYIRVDSIQIDNLKRLIQKELKSLVKNTNLGKIKVWFYLLPNSPVTKLSPETRMGKGKGPIIGYCCYIRPGQLLFETANLPKIKTLELSSKIKNSLSFKVQSLFKFY
uniref:ribosomal protein L16 n=1 Tax=Bangia atropurpurea TaxID=31347 RepID=UPI0007C5E19A|nr:ribosomal protein L16 [Bangia atropurpurea]UNJ18834.1 ribosomal protein L16 [Bangia atropurpurea]